MEFDASPSTCLPLHIVIAALQFAVPEIMSPGEARVLCRGAASALAAPSFWRGMTVNLRRDEREPFPRQRPETTATAGTVRVASTQSALRVDRHGEGPSRPTVATTEGDIDSSPRHTVRSGNGAQCVGRNVGFVETTRSNCDGCTGAISADVRPGQIGGNSGSDRVKTEKRSRTALGRNADNHGRASGGRLNAAGREKLAENGRHFLRRYHHHVAFRRLTPPVTDTETVDMPVPLYPTCIDSCGLMVAVGTREGPVILFHVGPRHASGPCSTMPVRKKPHHETNEPSPAVTSTRRSSSNNSGRSHGRGNRPDGQAGSAVRALRNFSRDTASTSPGRVTGGGGGGGGGATATTVIRVYGSLAGGDGPISAVLLDRSKVIAAGRGSRRYGNKFVIRIYAVDSTRLLRTLRCAGEVSRMCLFDPMLAVLSLESGRISFRDIYADEASGLGQRTALRVDAVAFAPIEIPTNDASMEGGVVLHCTNSFGQIFEVNLSGTVRNIERDILAAVPSAAWGSSAALRGWHLCADFDASILVRATPWGAISGWRLDANGCRVCGSVFSFSLQSAVSSSLSAARILSSVSLAAGGRILSTAWEGTAPRLWDVRLARGAIVDHAPTAYGGALSSSSSSASLRGSASAQRAQGADTTGATEVIRGWGLASVDVPEVLAGEGRLRGRGHQEGSGVTGGNRANDQKPRCVAVRPWPAGAWAVGVTVDAGSGTLASACSDGRWRITKLRPNTEEQRLRAAVNRGRKARTQQN